MKKDLNEEPAYDLGFDSLYCGNYLLALSVSAEGCYSNVHSGPRTCFLC